jgi:hypothetical protein
MTLKGEEGELELMRVLTLFPTGLVACVVLIVITYSEHVVNIGVS